jgi:hypothetical protein
MLSIRERAPSARIVATTAAIVVTTVLILEWGVWYFAGLIALYIALDIAQRLEERREARTMMAILRTAGRRAAGIWFKASERHCEQAAWIARELGWQAEPLLRHRIGRYSIRFLPAPSAAPLSTLLQALDRDKLISRIRVPDYLPKTGDRRNAASPPRAI